MLPFGLGEYLESALKPHLIYYRRQGIYLAVAAVFGVTGLLFLALIIFLALAYAVGPLLAAVICALLSAAVAGILLQIVQRRARVRARTSAEVVAIEEGREAEISAARMRAASSFFSSAMPALAVAVLGFLLGRRRR